jgi:hypothetical protein
VVGQGDPSAALISRRAVLEALGKKRGAEDDKSQAQRFHDALTEAWALVPRVCLVPSWHQPHQPSLSPLTALP